MLNDFLQSNSLLSFYLILAFALLLTRIPKVGCVFFVINTMIHEASHALMALLSSGKVLRIHLFKDTSGVTVTQSYSRWSSFLISLSGYFGASLFCFLSYYLIHIGKHEYLIFLLMGICFLCLIFFIRNTYGMIWGIGFIILNFLLFYYVSDFYIKVVSMFYAGIIFFESLITAIKIMLISFKNPKSSGDATSLKNITLIPAFVWGILFFLFALLTNVYCVWIFFPFN